MRSLLRWTCGVALLSMAIMACGSNETIGTQPTTTTAHGGQGGQAGSGGTGGAVGGTGGGGGPGCRESLGEGGGSCTPTSYHTTPTESVVDTVTVDIQDLDGNPAGDVLVMLESFNMSHPASADGSGHYVIDATGFSLTEPRLLYGDGVAFVTLVASLPSTPDADFGFVSTARLPDAASGVPLVPGQDAVSGDVTLRLAASASAEFDILSYCFADEQTFRAVTIPVDGSATLPSVDPALGLEMLFGMAPERTQFCPAAQMTVPNAPGWPADAEVEFWYLGTSFYYLDPSIVEDYAPWGGWGKVSDGVVAADGTAVSTDPDEGIPVLGVIGVRLKP
jgi:hypothetical protein